MTKTGDRDRKEVTDSCLRTQDCWDHQAPAERQGICTLLSPAGPIHSLHPRGLSYRFHPTPPTHPAWGGCHFTFTSGDAVTDDKMQIGGHKSFEPRSTQWALSTPGMGAGVTTAKTD